MTKKIPKILVAVLAILVGLYPAIYFFINRKFGLLQSKSEALLANPFWNIEFYSHIIFGGLALLVGWTQFSAKLRARNLKLHRQVGKVYVVCALISAMAGIYIALYATGGMIPSVGFMSLGAVWFYTTLRAYMEIRKGRVDEHQKMMIYSYAACFSAVTLRIYLPILTSLFQDFTKAYMVVAWLCWIPNIIVAFFIIKRLDKIEFAVR
ncbi:DUF2306 domain-containing protein [Terrimonas pollutisoli]|uniref:DUF2306 domain-containing protein n=1 Tax=Terrimonas pollutisoli TaxID=3034147 RepID=UPI0023EE07AD|nr:DUF2306 domain-containing protein [Terrimonas sp. H1YJ31]